MRSLVAALLLCSFALPAVAEDCIASVYWVNDGSQPGTRTASGIPLNNNALTAAMKQPWPLRSKVKVTNKANGKSVILTITDRGPYVRGRCIDVTRAAARALGFSGLARVTVERVH